MKYLILKVNVCKLRLNKKGRMKEKDLICKLQAVKEVQIEHWILGLKSKNSWQVFAL